MRFDSSLGANLKITDMRPTFIEVNETILSLVDGFEASKKVINFLTNERIKQEHRDSLPFSQQLNDWVCLWYEQHKDIFVFTDTDDFDEDDIEGTLQKHIDRFEKTGKIHIWTGASDNTIFANPEVNHYFRAWHDYIHVTERLGYDFIGESMVAAIQMAQLPETYVFERQLVHSEIVGQAMHFMKHGGFVNNQREFTIMFLNNGRV